MKNLLIILTLGLIVSRAFLSPLRAATSETNNSTKGESKDDDSKDKKYFEEPPPSTATHTISLDGKTLKYHTTAGYIILKEEEGKPLFKQAAQKPAQESKPDTKSESEPTKTKDGLKAKAKIFFVAYVRDDAGDTSARPVTFCFNGGPGSSSVWLHMASVAPRRANLTDEGEAPPPPYQLVDNESTWLDRTDLVFIDPVSTGFSRAGWKRGRAAISRIEGRHRQRGRFHPSLCLAQQPMAFAKVHSR